MEVGRDLIVTGNEIYLPPAPPPPRDQRWLDELRAYVRREVEQWLTAEVGGGPLLRMPKEELSEAVGRRRPLLVGPRDDRLLDPAEAIGDVFADEAGRSLLVLGEPGSGKSVLLHRLARDLLARPGAEAEPVPVLLELSAWAPDGRPFIEWLASADGLRRSYRSIGDAQLLAWLREGRLTLLLDGLDEVRAEYRRACVEAINAFLAGAGGGAPGGVAVASRVDEYHAVAREAGPLDLSTAIYLRPLAEEQVRQYLDSAGPHLEGLRQAWETDGAVRDLARNPLMLRTMSLALEEDGAGAGTLGLEGEPLRDRLLDAYVDRVFDRAEERVSRHPSPEALPGVDRVFGGDAAWARGDQVALPFGREEVVRRLGWLALRMQEHARTTFYVEELQPSWLPLRQRRLYALLSRSAGGGLLGLTGGALLLMGLWVSGSLFGIGEAALTGGMILGLSGAGALLVGSYDAYLFSGAGPAPALHRVTARVGTVAALGALGAAAFAGAGQRGAYGLVFGVVWGVVVAVVFEPAAGWRRATHDVRLVEPLRWSRRSALRAARRALAGGGLAGAALGAVVVGSRASGGSVPGAAVVVVMAVATALLAAVVGGALGGLKHGSVRAAPRHNLGLRLSLRNAGFAGAVTAVAASAVVLVLGLASGALGVGGAALLGLAGGLFCGLLAALRHGGLNAVYHGTLRLLLDRAGYLPRGAAPFLRFATDLSLMRSAGGGYAFAHRLFAEYFAERGGGFDWAAGALLPSESPAGVERGFRARLPRPGVAAARDRG